MAGLSIGLVATKAPWSAALRSYVRDHCQGVAVEVVMDRPGLARALSKIDVLVLDDVMRTFSIGDVARAQDCGVRVIGLFDQSSGMGRSYLSGLGADQTVPASTPPSELLAFASQLKPRRALRQGAQSGPAWQAHVAVGGTRRPGGLISAWTKVSGGAGLTEAVVAAAEHISKRSRVLVIEAEEVAPVLASRLTRSPEAGLPWALSRAGQGLRALPDGLSGARGDGTAPLGHFDVICATSSAVHAINAGHLERLMAEAARCYDHVLVETSWLVGAPSQHERFSAVASVLQSAGAVVVLAAADPEGAARLVQWRAAGLAVGVGARCWAVFGRARRSRYEVEHLQRLVDANTGRYPFDGFRFLPEDQTVARARWNAEIVWKGPWSRSVLDLVGTALGPVSHDVAAEQRAAGLGASGVAVNGTAGAMAS